MTKTNVNIKMHAFIIFILFSQGISAQFSSFAYAGGYLLGELKASPTYLYAGGGFTSVNYSVPANNIARWDGISWSDLGGGVHGGSAPWVSAICISGNDVYVGGLFDSAGGIAANNIAKWNGTSWSALGTGVSGPSSPWLGTVVAICVSGTDVYVTGSFTTAGGITVNGIAKWDGNSWSALGTGLGAGGWFVNAAGYALTVLGNDLYVGGEFYTAGGIVAKGIAKWNGTSWSAMGTGLSTLLQGYGKFVKDMVLSGTDIYIAGSFDSAGSVSVNNIAKWNGSNWSALGTGMSGGWSGGTNNATQVLSLALNGNTLYAGGHFDYANGIQANNIAKWNGTQWDSIGNGIILANQVINAYVTELAFWGNNFYAGGRDFYSPYCDIAIWPDYNTATGIKENIGNDKGHIFPNPFLSETTLITNENCENATLTIYDSFGRQVKKIKNISGKTINLHKDNLPIGVYYIRLSEENKIDFTDKIIIAD